MSVPGAVNQETGVIEGISAVTLSMAFLGMKFLPSSTPCPLENDTNCVGLSELLAHPG